MKNYIYILSIVMTFFSCENSSKQNTKLLKIDSKIQKDNAIKIDSIKASKAKAIIKARLLKFEGGDKYYYSNLSVLEVLLNKTNYNFSDSIRVAFYNWNEGIPKNKDCILYIVPWPLESVTLNKKQEWMLIDGNGKYACECK